MTTKCLESLPPNTLRLYDFTHTCGHTGQRGFWVQYNGIGADLTFIPDSVKEAKKNRCFKCAQPTNKNKGI